MLSLSGLDWKREATTRERFMFAVIFVACLFVAVRMWWMPMQMKIGKIKAERVMVDLQIDALQRLIDATQRQVAGRAKPSSLDGATGDANRVRSIVDKISAAPAENVARAMHLLSGRRILGGLAFRGVKREEYKLADGYVIIPLSVSVKGTFNAMQRYLGKLEQTELPLLVHSVSMKREQDRSGIVTGTLMIDLFVQKAGASMAGVPGQKQVAAGRQDSGEPKAKR